MCGEREVWFAEGFSAEGVVVWSLLMALRQPKPALSAEIFP
jgi:hypothetical protein